MKSTVALVIAIFALVSLAAAVQLEPTCDRVNAALAPCVKYLIGHGGKGPSRACCAGVQVVKEMVQTSKDKKVCCHCVKTAAGHHPDMKDEVALGLPAKCGVQLDIPISRDIDCDKLVIKKGGIRQDA